MDAFWMGLLITLWTTANVLKVVSLRRVGNWKLHDPVHLIGNAVLALVLAVRPLDSRPLNYYLIASAVLACVEASDEPRKKRARLRSRLRLSLGAPRRWAIGV